MEYTINELAKLAGISTRTLRYYDSMGLLVPEKITPAGYRIYGTAQADRLQQILFYKSLGFRLDKIKTTMRSTDFERLTALREQKELMQRQRGRLDALIDTISKTIESEEGNKSMDDNEKFEGFKKGLVEENEREYGVEIRAKYGDGTVDESNALMMNLTPQQYGEMQQLGAEINRLLEQGVAEKHNPQGKTGRQIAELHKKWLGYTWAHYTPEAHLGLGEMYVADARFSEYYDKNVPGCAAFLRDAIKEHVTCDE
jgi:Predicted transcriptional regulators